MTSVVNAHASYRHFYDKLLPVWNALPKDLKGEFTVHPRLDGLPNVRVDRYPNKDGILMCASHADSLHSANKYIYIEHGAGQSYQSGSNFYSNCYRPNMLAALVPGPYCARKTKAANPDTPVIVMGAPHLADIKRKDPQKLTFAWHWRCGVAMETDTAFDEYREVMVECSTKWETVGHGHPRIIGELSAVYAQNNIPTVYDSREALTHAGLLVADNTSLIYEAAVLDIPVVLVNKETYRRDKEWGLRFWEAQPGPYVDHPAELVATVEAELSGDKHQWADMRHQVSDYVYGPRPFTSLLPAVDQLVDLLEKKNAHNY